MRATDDDYRNQLLALAPVGRAWSRDLDAQFPGLMLGVAGELARAHNRAVELVEEADPQTTDEMLEDWERVAGFPDPCIPLPGEADARRQAVVGRLAARGGQSAAYYTTLCASLGYGATVTDYRHFTMGVSACGEMVLNGDGHRFTAGANQCGEHLEVFDWDHAWRLEGEPSIRTNFVMGASCTGEHFGYRDNPQIRCLIARLKPTHSRVAYRWNGPSPSEEFPDVTIDGPFDFVAGDGQCGMPLGGTRSTTFSAVQPPLTTYQ